MPQHTSVTPRELVIILAAEAWKWRPCPHGIFFSTGRGPTYRKTTIPVKRNPIPRGTLRQIVGPKQTGWGMDGLRSRLQRHGLRKP